MSETAPVVSSTPGYSQASVGDFTVESNTETAEQLQENFGEPDPVKEAAKKLGEKGGKASAEKRAGGAEPDSGPDDKPRPDGDSGAVEGDDKPLGKPRDDPKARMLQATREAAELKRQIAAERAEKERYAQELAEARKAREAPAEGQARQAPQDSDPEPSDADYDNYADYVKASARWAARQEHAQIQTQVQARAEADRWTKAVKGTADAFEARVNKIKETDPECLSKVSDDVWALMVPSFVLEGEPVTQYNVIADEVMLSENGLQMLQHFTEHPEEFQRIATLRTPREISRALAKVESKFEAATAGTSPKLVSSAAKPPIRPVMGSPSAVGPDEENEDIDSFLSRKVARR